MDGVLEGAAGLCACKLACSLVFLPSLASSYSPVSFCCCCLLIFTDFLVTVFLTFLILFESWLTELTALGDVVALRFLLFLSHTYGSVLLLTTPLIAVETLVRLLLLPRSRTADVGKPNAEEEEDGDGDGRPSHVAGYLCCLSVWVVVAVNVRWRWKLEEAWVAACVHETESLVSCLPKLFNPTPIAVNPCWVVAFLVLLLVVLLTGLQGRHDEESKDDCGLVPPSSECVDKEKTESSCTVHTAYSWNGVQMSPARRHGDSVLVSPGCLSGWEQGRTKRGAPVTFTTEEHVDSEHRWGFPRPGVNVMIGLASVLSIFLLPLNLSVNVLLIRTTEALLELLVKSLAPRDASGSHNETLV